MTGRWLRLVLRRLGDDRAATVAFVGLVAAVAVVAALAPAWYLSTGDEALRAEVSARTAADRSLQFLREGTIRAGPADDPLGPVQAEGVELFATVPDPVGALVSGTDVVVEGARHELGVPTSDPSYLRLRVMVGFDALVRYVDGGPPTDAIGRRGLDDASAGNLPVFEVGISAATLERFDLALGDVVPLRGDPSDPLANGVEREIVAFASIAGVYETIDPTADVWLGDALLQRPVIRALSAEDQRLDAAVILHPAAYAGWLDHVRGLGGDLRYTWRGFTDAGRFGVGSAPELGAALRRLQAAYPSVNVTPTTPTALRSSLLPIVEGFDGRWRAVSAILAVILVGPAVAAAGAMLLTATLSGGRRTRTLGLALARGASRAQVWIAGAAEGALIVVPVVLAAGMLALALTGGAAGGAAWVAGAGAGLAAWLTVVASVARLRHADAGRPAAAGTRRRVLDLTVVAIAVAAAIVLRTRSIAPRLGGPVPAQFDPLLAAAPPLIGLAAGLVALRVLPLPLAIVGWAAARARGLVPLLASRRAAEGGAAGAVMLVLLGTTAIGVFSASLLGNLDRGAQVAAVRRIGGDVRIESAAGSALEPTAFGGLEGVRAAAGVLEVALAIDLTGPRVRVFAVDAEAYEAILATTAEPTTLPPAFGAPANGPIPAIVSPDVSVSPRGAALGESFRMVIEGYELSYVVVDVRDTLPGLASGGSFVVVPREAIRAAAPAARFATTTVLLGVEPGTDASVRLAAATLRPDVRVDSRIALERDLRDSPITRAVRDAALAASLLTGVFAAVGTIAALALAGIRRQVETAQLRTMGLPADGIVRLMVAEQLPTAAMAVAIGIGLGLGLFALVGPGLGLGVLVGAEVDLVLGIDLGILGLVALGTGVVLVLGLGLGAGLAGRLSPAAAIRGRLER